jgi:UDP-N-acetylglucosamine diphosphorylase/glucosamine-1-phosphate N-acetyltransferase
VIAACLPASAAAGLLDAGPVGLRKVEWRDAGAAMLTRPWSTRAVRDAAIDADLKTLALLLPRFPGAPGVTVMGSAVHAHPSARVSPTAVLDAEAGPVVLDEASVVRPGAIVIGPAYVGPRSTVLERATIRPHTAIGPSCKVNGEVGGCVFQGFANKAHDGYLGDSWVGEWVNLGAGTTNSNLLNTYGEVIAKASPDGRSERTGQQFLGATIGDHVKTAICTRLFTGCVLGAGCMFAGTAPVSGCVPAFSWVTDEGARPYRFDKFLEVARAAMARRKLTPGPAYVDRLRELAGRTGG